MTRPAASSTNTNFLVAPPAPDSCWASIPESDEKTGASARDRPLVLLISKSASGLAGQIGLLSKGTISGSATSLAGAGAAAAPPVGTGATLLVVSDWGSALRVASAKDGRADATDSKPCLEIGCQGNSFGAWLETVYAGLAFDHGNRESTRIRAGIACALEQQTGILLVLAIDDDCVEVLRHQLFDCSEWLVAALNLKFQFTQNLRDDAGSFVVWTE